MLRVLSILLLMIATGALSAQIVVGERTAELVEANYTITGTATILEYDDGTISFILSDDFDTPVGPDVRVYLNDEISPISAVELVNLSTINHFSGALALEVPPGTDLEVNDKVVFYCFAFSQLWASGQFGDVVDPNPMNNDTCLMSLTATTDWVTAIDLCTATDGDQEIDLKNNIGETPGEKYAYLLTDTNEVLLEVVLDSVYTVAEGMLSPLRFYGLSYRGELDAMIGQDRHNTTATDCFIHSGGELYLTVAPQGSCATSSVDEQLTAATQLFPNPVQRQLQLRFPAQFSAQSIMIFNGVGQRLSTFGVNGSVHTIEVGRLAAGRYLLLAIDGRGRQVRKAFIKE